MYIMIRYISHIYIVCACVYLSLVYTRTYTCINLHRPVRPHQTQHHPRRAPGQNHLAPAPRWIPVAGGRVCVGAGGPSIPPSFPEAAAGAFPKHQPQISSAKPAAPRAPTHGVSLKCRSLGGIWKSWLRGASADRLICTLALK